MMIYYGLNVRKINQNGLLFDFSNLRLKCILWKYIGLFTYRISALSKEESEYYNKLNDDSLFDMVTDLYKGKMM